MLRVEELVQRFESEGKGTLLTAADLAKIGSGEVGVEPIWDFLGAKDKQYTDNEASDPYWNIGVI